MRKRKGFGELSEKQSGYRPEKAAGRYCPRTGSVTQSALQVERAVE